MGEVLLSMNVVNNSYDYHKYKPKTRAEPWGQTVGRIGSSDGFSTTKGPRTLSLWGWPGANRHYVVGLFSGNDGGNSVISCKLFLSLTL
jgi:hypothetical protein